MQISKISKNTSVVSRTTRSASVRPVQVRAYGKDGKFIDLTDLPNTTGSWDMYGQDSPKRYPSMQATFFSQAADVLTRREALRAFVALFGIGAIVGFGAEGSIWASLPITKAPAKTENGKGGTVRSKV